MKREEILAMVAKVAGSPSVQKEVDIGNGKQMFTFLRLPFVEVDKLRLRAIGEDGKFNKELHAGAKARLVAAALVDDNGEHVFSEAVAMQQFASIIEPLAAAAEMVNGLTTPAQDEIAKKSLPAAS